ncbi:MerR family transcriptional regulator [Pseudonocardia sp. NPDC049635]|uniref:MerR family transcriptional regulator n=1 Tax=Pseudonocardia sp. NPDC049635 TaxID=3155506 RepID=UPI0033F08027
MLIGEVSRRSGISARMLRHYDAIGLVSPTGRTGGGYRRYSEDDVRRLFHVEGLRTLGMSLQGIADVLDGVSFDPGAIVEHLIERTRDRLARDEELLGRLERVRASDPAAWSDVLRTIGLMRGLEVDDPSSRQRLALSLTGQDERDAVLLAEAVLGESDPTVAGALVWALARAGDAGVRVVATALDSPDTDRRHRALGALMKIGSPQALAAVAEAFRHADPVVRGRAAIVRGTLGGADALPALVALVVEGRDDVEAADALGLLASRYDRAEGVVRALADEIAGRTGATRLRLVSALADIPGPEAEAVLDSLSADPDRQVSLTAAHLLRVRRGQG